MKKMKTEDEVDGDSKILENEIKKNSKIMFKYRDKLKKDLTRPQIREIIESNNQKVPAGVEDVSEV